MILVIDRIEHDKVVCINDDTQKEYIYHRPMIPKWSKEGDILILENNSFKYSPELTKKRNAEIAVLVNRMFNK
jgi:hypothetical protein